MALLEKLVVKRSTLLESLFFVLSILSLVYLKFFKHELWKDEWQAWFVAKDKNIIEVFSFLNYEGHPALWYLYLKPFTWIADIIPVNAEYILSFAHLIPGVIVLFLFWKKFGLPTSVQISFAFSYFLLFEYGLVNRGYILVILCLFAAVLFIKKENLKGLGWSLILLCQTEVFGVFMAIALGFYLFLLDKSKYTNVLKWLTFGVFVFVISVFPRESGHIARTQGKAMEFGDKILTSFQGNLTNAFLPGITPDTSLFGWSGFGVFLSLILIFCFYYIFRKDKKIMSTFFLVLFMSIGFSIFFFVGGIRQWGMMFIFFIALLALLGETVFKDIKIIVLLLFIGIAQTTYGFKAIYSDIYLPFSNAKAAGLYIKETIPARVPIVAINKFEITPVIGYAQRNFYELPTGEEFSYFKWVEKIYIPTQEELRLFAKFKGVGGLVIIAPKKLDPGRFSDAILGKEFIDKNIKNENYFLYTLSVN